MNSLQPQSLVAAILIPAAVAAFAYAPRAEACVAGIVSAESAVTADSQLALLSVRRPAGGATTTDVVVLLSVPDASSDFGALIPLPASGEPTIDPVAVDGAAFTDLEAITRPVFEDFSGGGGGGGGGLFACGVPADLAGGEGNGRNVIAGPSVDVGPITAQWLVANDSAALLTYLDDNGFTLPAGGAAVVDGYIAGGNGFLAFKRNDSAPSTEPVALGVHFNAPGDLRTIPLQIAQFGAPAVLPVTVFVADQEPVGTEVPWSAVDAADLNDVDAIADYAGLIDTLTAAADGKLWILESVSDRGAFDNALLSFVDDGAVLSRLTARIPQAELDADASFTAPAPTPTEPAAASSMTLPRRVDVAGLGLLVATLVLRRRKR